MLTKQCKWLKINYMTLPSTQHQLVRLAYGELPVLERLETEFCLEENYTLREDYEELRHAMREMPRVTFRPQRSTINAVLAYSRNAGMAA